MAGWQIGLQKAAAQNLARQLCEMPGNLLTPIAFAQAAVEALCKAAISVEVKVKLLFVSVHSLVTLRDVHFLTMIGLPKNLSSVG